MKLFVLFIALLVPTCTSTYGQDLDTTKLDQYFDALKKRNEAMGSLVIARNGNVLYQRAIGMRDADTEIPADNDTNYRVWSVTKTYTATMIMQLAEEGKLSLDTTLDTFYPNIPNAGTITMRQMLQHKSGIHDFIQNDTSEDWDTYIEEPLTPAFMVQHISQYPPDFPPGTDFRYSNSNYLLLGYIIVQLDGLPYETALHNRISSKIGLTSTYFGAGALDEVDNKAHSYRYSGQWLPVDEGTFSGLIPAGAGGIVSTPMDMAIFIDALFAGKLITPASLDLMLPADAFYGLGLMQIPFNEQQGYGHTGGYIASESSLVHYPDDSLTVAYATNGIVQRKEDILNNVLRIYHGKPFAVSMNRPTQALIVFCIGLLLFITIKPPARTQYLRWAGLAIALLFWAGVFIAGVLYDDYSHIRDGLTILDGFYSGSGTLMAGLQLVIAGLLIPFTMVLYRQCKALGISILPLFPMLFISCSMLGASLFPFPNEMYTLFANLIVLSALGPFLTVVMWRQILDAQIRWASAACLLLMLISLGFIFSRAALPELVHTYWGLIQRSLYLGWTLWLAALSIYVMAASPAKATS